MKIEIYDPAMCCSTGVCGPSVDPELVRMQESLRQIKNQAPQVEIERYSLSNDPKVFVDNTAVAELLKDDGPQCLPLVLVDGQCLSKGSYPPNDQLVDLLKKAGHEVTLETKKQVPNCCSSGCC